MTFSVDISGQLELESFLEAAPAVTRQAVALAMNDVLSGSGLARYRGSINEQVNFPTGYVNDQRFGMDKRATPSNLTASLVGRQRPTSLARFATSGVIGAKGGVSVKVKKEGSTTRMPSAFLVKLKAGTASIADNYNVGLAIRLAPGQTLNKKDTSQMVHLDKNVVLLYGPSIDQILNNSVIDKDTPEVVSDVATEFFRQFARLSNG